jgi:hypothetical protein
MGCGRVAGVAVPVRGLRRAGVRGCCGCGAVARCRAVRGWGPGALRAPAAVAGAAGSRGCGGCFAGLPLSYGFCQGGFP